MLHNHFFRSTTRNTLLFSFSLACTIGRIWAESNSTQPVSNDNNNVAENQEIITSWIWYLLNMMILVCYPMWVRPVINKCRHTLRDELETLQNQFALIAPVDELEIKIDNPTDVTCIPLSNITRFEKEIETSLCENVCVLIANAAAFGTGVVGLLVVGPMHDEKAGMILLMVSSFTSCISAYFDSDLLNKADNKALLEKSHFEFKNTNRDDALRYLNTLSFLSREQPLIVTQGSETPKLILSPGN